MAFLGHPSEPWGIEDFGKDLVSLLDHLELGPVHFCGLSLGGMTGLWLGQESPGLVEKLVLANCSAVIEDPALLRGRMKVIAREGLESIAENVLERWFTPGFASLNPERIQEFESMVLRTPAEGYLATCDMLCEFDLRPRLGRIDIAALVITGTHDLASPKAWGEAVAAGIPSAELLQLEAAHLSNVEAAGAFNDAILEFLS